jgi:hypothetical protein
MLFPKIPPKFYFEKGNFNYQSDHSNDHFTNATKVIIIRNTLKYFHKFLVNILFI